VNLRHTKRKKTNIDDGVFYDSMYVKFLEKKLEWQKADSGCLKREVHYKWHENFLRGGGLETFESQVMVIATELYNYCIKLHIKWINFMVFKLYLRLAEWLKW
jgi:hypothetical protein